MLPREKTASSSASTLPRLQSPRTTRLLISRGGESQPHQFWNIPRSETEGTSQRLTDIFRCTQTERLDREYEESQRALRKLQYKTRANKRFISSPKKKKPSFVRKATAIEREVQASKSNNNNPTTIESHHTTAMRTTTGGSVFQKTAPTLKFQTLPKPTKDRNQIKAERMRNELILKNRHHFLRAMNTYVSQKNLPAQNTYFEQTMDRFTVGLDKIRGEKAKPLSAEKMVRTTRLEENFDTLEHYEWLETQPRVDKKANLAAVMKSHKAYQKMRTQDTLQWQRHHSFCPEVLLSPVTEIEKFARELYVFLDQDNSGTLEPHEIVHPLIALGLAPDFDFVRDMMEALRAKRDDPHIKLDDFVSLIEGNRVTNRIIKVLNDECRKAFPVTTNQHHMDLNHSLSRMNSGSPDQMTLRKALSMMNLSPDNTIDSSPNESFSERRVTELQIPFEGQYRKTTDNIQRPTILITRDFSMHSESQTILSDQEKSRRNSRIYHSKTQQRLNTKSTAPPVSRLPDLDIEVFNNWIESQKRHSKMVQQEKILFQWWNEINPEGKAWVPIKDICELLLRKTIFNEREEARKYVLSVKVPEVDGQITHFHFQKIFAKAMFRSALINMAEIFITTKLFDSNASLGMRLIENQRRILQAGLIKKKGPKLHPQIREILHNLQEYQRELMKLPSDEYDTLTKQGYQEKLEEIFNPPEEEESVIDIGDQPLNVLQEELEASLNESHDEDDHATSIFNTDNNTKLKNQLRAKKSENFTRRFSKVLNTDRDLAISNAMYH